MTTSADTPRGATIDDLADYAGVKNSMAVSSTLSMLGRQRIIERFDIPGKRMRGTRLLQPDMLARDLKLDRAALKQMAAERIVKGPP